ncbi:uncharacterized protein BT62DRAFT_995877 [Guyanagaster necrorhizus]|uniref:RanBP2-type domain-containing protein n=1 Tax=Guyanagaster necrorhizus TaxID=856835 RepID=A0A9P7VLW4_9AGAR|nr:uncharacterized protein BT62DRAFT_995877 [Guyanagaster necrorhizus MCA 3950]KAG7443596.1 hypothetical protein BT62DRAFT_995877 [Guyanagaster necrorhizus MCA 3950]
MSAIRTTPSRSHRGSSPYVRPEPKKSLWSLSGILHYLNPLRSRDDMETDELPSPPVADPSVSPQPPPNAGQVATQPSNTNSDDASGASAPPPPVHPPVLPQTIPAPPSNVSFATMPPLDSTEATLESVAAYLHDRRNQTLPSADADNLISKLMEAVAYRERQPFRFTASPSPLRGTSPALAANSEASGSPSKMLTKNPNGAYRWEGGGSAKVRSRDRYRSPAFGPSRATPDRLILNHSLSASITDNSKADTKRRRVSNGTRRSFAATLQKTPSPSMVPRPLYRTKSVSIISRDSDDSTSSTSIPATNGSPSKLNGLPASTSTPRFRSTFAPPKPTTPTIPSPLRQAWGQSSSGSPESPPQTQKQSSAANFMAGLIKDNTPTKKPDISNPYQTPGSARARPKRPRVMEKATTPKKQAVEEKKEKVYSPQAIIEATVPKGSKRSRPPTSAVVAEPVPAPKSYRVTVEDVEDEDEDENQRISKKMKPTVNDHATISISSKDAEMLKPETKVNGVNGSNAPAPLLFSSARIGRSSNVPKEPSKLRFSYQPETPGSPPPAPVLAAAVLPSANTKPVHTFPFPTAIPAPTFSFPTTPSASSSSTVTPTFGVPDPKAAALALSPSSLPSFSFASSSPKPLSSESWDAEARGRAKAASTFELPAFLFPLAGPSKSPATTPAVAAPAPTAPPKSFDWSRAGIEPPSKAAAGEWTCGTCSLTNTDPDAEKCYICGERREKPKPALPAATFDWATAEMKPPAAAANQWKCSACMLTQGGTDKCAICETPRA